jgi:integrase
MPRNKIVRHQLPNGCSCSQISVMPKNWKQAKKVNGQWRIFYTFYDPANGKRQVSVKHMNQYLNIDERKYKTQEAIDIIMQGLQMGYNPFYKKIVHTRVQKYDIDEQTLFIPALKKALERIKLSDKYRQHISGYVIPNVEKAAIHLGYHVLFISQVKRKNIVYILDRLKEVSPRFSDNTFNRYRTDLKRLFKELVRVEAIENNPINEDLEKKQVEQQERTTLTKAERIFVNNLLAEKYPVFHRFLHIFFHGFTRETELMRLKGCDVDLDNQRFRITIFKGNKQKTVWKVIQTEALLFWREAMKNCKPDDYVFSRRLLPGPSPIRPDQITKRWYRLIKKKEFVINGKKTRITADFYSLHHTATTQMVDMFDQETAAEAKSHTTTKMVAKVYDIKSKSRYDEKIKRAPIKFA